MIDPAFFQQDAVICARELIGSEMVHGPCRGRIIETEAYHETGDEACHLFSRPSARAFAERHVPGTAYVYLNYGVHWLTNVLCVDARTGEKGFVLFRALDPVEGIDLMQQRRQRKKERDLCSGPGKLSAALGIGPELHERCLLESPDFCFNHSSLLSGESVLEDRRVGISRAQHLPWRFLLKDHPGISVPYGKA